MQPIKDGYNFQTTLNNYNNYLMKGGYWAGKTIRIAEAVCMTIADLFLQAMAFLLITIVAPFKPIEMKIRNCQASDTLSQYLFMLPLPIYALRISTKPQASLLAELLHIIKPPEQLKDRVAQYHTFWA